MPAQEKYSKEFTNSELGKLWENINSIHDEDSIDFNRYKYILGIDFGHGETAAQYITLNKDLKPEHLVTQVTPAAILNKNPVIPSIYAEDAAGLSLIGECAFSDGCTNFSLGFKTRPKEWRNYPQEKEIIKKFMKSVYKNILYFTEALERGNHIVAIGCPCAWEKEERYMYQKLFFDAIHEDGKEQDIPLNAIRTIRCTKEARAAAIYSRRMTSLDIPQSAVEQGLLLVDMGSSTIDYTHIQKDKKLLDDGVDLGASLIDAMLLLYSLGDDISLDDIIAIEKIITLEPQYLFNAISQCRIAKELYYKGNRNAQISYDFNKKQKLRISSSVDAAIKAVTQKLKFPLHDSWKEVFFAGLHALKAKKNSTDDADFCLFIRSKNDASQTSHTWLEHFENSLQKQKQRLEDGQRNTVEILLTGGAASMDFVKDIVKKVFGVQPKRDPEPSLCIAKGIVLAGRTDVIASELKSKLNKACDSGIKYYTGQENINKLLKSLHEDLFVKFQEIYNKTLAEWEGSFLEGKGSLEKRLKTAEDIFHSELNSIIKGNIQKNTTEITERIVKLLDDICGMYGYKDTIKKFTLDGITDMKIDIVFNVPDTIIESIIELVGKIMFGILGIILAIITWIKMHIKKNEIVEQIKAQYPEIKRRIECELTEQHISNCYECVAKYINEYVKVIINKATVEIDIEDDVFEQDEQKTVA